MNAGQVVEVKRKVTQACDEMTSVGRVYAQLSYMAFARESEHAFS